MSEINKNSVHQRSSAGDLVVITHIESPTLFYCRFEQEVCKYEELSEMIKKLINTKPLRMVDLSNKFCSNIYLLVFSVIQNEWCRGRLLSLKFDQEVKPVCAKVWLMDYGSIEFVSWKPEYVKTSTPEINGYNGGKGLCFPCCLHNIKPFTEGVNGIQMPQHDWTSYANYLFKKETDSRKFRLKMVPSNFDKNDKKITCDLFPINDYPSNHQSLSHCLVESNVAQYIDS